MFWISNSEILEYVGMGLKPKRRNHLYFMYTYTDSQKGILYNIFSRPELGRRALAVLGPKAGASGIPHIIYY